MCRIGEQEHREEEDGAGKGGGMRDSEAGRHVTQFLNSSSKSLFEISAQSRENLR